MWIAVGTATGQDARCDPVDGVELGTTVHSVDLAFVVKMWMWSIDVIAFA